MKKWLIVALGLIAVVLLAGCRDKEVEKQSEWKSLDSMYGNISFTMEELEVLEDELFPSLYSYTTYDKKDWSVLEEGNHIYWSNHEFLLPIDEYITDKVVSSSEVENGMIYTMVDGKVGDESVSVLYINDPETLKYSFATVYWKNENILYAFRY